MGEGGHNTVNIHSEQYQYLQERKRHSFPTMDTEGK